MYKVQNKNISTQKKPSNQNSLIPDFQSLQVVNTLN